MLHLLTRGASILALVWIASFFSEVVAEETSDTFSSGNKNEREMVRALEAYAVYKMGQYQEAHQRFLSLAEIGNIQGMLNVANMYAAGVGVEEDQRLATHWYRQAAEKGSEIAIKEYAVRLGQGNGIKRDSTASSFWLKKLEQVSLSNAVAAQVQPALLAEVTPRIESRLEEFDQAANGKSAAGMVEWVGPGTHILAVLPGTRNWTTLNKLQLKALWQTGFELPGEYRYERSNTEYWVERGQLVRASFIVREEWRSVAKPEKIQQRIVIQNDLQLVLISEVLTVREWKMHIRQAH